MNLKNIKSLMALLEDENQVIASGAMNELLKYGKASSVLARKYQENSNPILRKRIHQLQAVAKTRKSRDILSRRLNNTYSGLWNGLLEIHMLWFDKDAKENINELFLEFLGDFKAHSDFSFQAVALFMKTRGFVTPIKGDIDADFYCLGPVLESKIGCEEILTILVYKLLLETGRKSKIIRIGNNFGVLSEEGYAVTPEDWKLFTPAKNLYKECSTGDILKSIILKLFLSAVASDGFRYAFAIGVCIAKASDTDGGTKFSSVLQKNTK